MKENETKNLLMQVFCKNFKDDYIKESFENAICNQCARRNPAVPSNRHGRGMPECYGEAEGDENGRALYE